MPDYLSLGASLYVPSTRDDLVEVARAEKIAHARSLIFCTEDSIREDELPLGLANIARMLQHLPERDAVDRRRNRLLFIRVRNVSVLSALLRTEHIQRIDGFVLPKLTGDNLMDYVSLFAAANQDLGKFKLMPTLETREVFDTTEMVKLRELLELPHIRPSVLALRIGGNDLLNLLGVRRSRYRTLYESALGPVISNLVTIFKPYGFNLTSPVCEFLYDHEILERELAQDVEYGLFGKTAIHPDQIAIIESAYRPSEQDAAVADAILAEGAAAVFNMAGAMCEVTTHAQWAQNVRLRRHAYGVYGKHGNCNA